MNNEDTIITKAQIVSIEGDKAQVIVRTENNSIDTWIIPLDVIGIKDLSTGDILEIKIKTSIEFTMLEEEEPAEFEITDEMLDDCLKNLKKLDNYLKNNKEEK